MMAYTGGDEFPCVVGEVGSYCTKMGFAGESYPRSYFRSTTAILRGDHREPNKITKRSYDFFTRPLGSGNGSGGGNPAAAGGGSSGGGDVCDDGEWEVCNPVQRATGLIYEGRKSSSASASTSHNSNEDMSVDGNGSPNGGEGSPSHETASGECYTHFLNHLSHGYETALSTDSSAAPLLLVERSYNPPPIRQKMMEILFEEMNVPATFLARDAVCACYAVGRSTGTVVDIGHAGTVVTPVYEGYVESKGILRSPAGSAMMEESILEYLDGLYKTKKSRNKLNSKHDYAMPLYQVRAKDNIARREPFHSLARLDMTRMCKEDGSGAGVASFGYAALHDLPDGEDGKPEPSEIYQQYAIAPKTPFKLPDGTQIDIPQTKRFDVAELLFGKEGGKSASIREEAVREANEKINVITATDGDSATEVNALAHVEEMTRRKRGTKSSNKKQSAYLSNEKLVKACTPYLQSAIGELTAASIPSMICDSAFKCDRDQQAQLLGNAVLCGGGACLSTSASSSNSVDYKDGNAMPERIREEVEAIIHTHTPQWRVKVLSPGLSERAVCSWLGASILGSLGSFHEMWITKKEYEEHGTAIVNRKCP
jgi:actin-related protein